MKSNKNKLNNQELEKFDFDNIEIELLENMLNQEIEGLNEELEVLRNEKEIIGNPENLGKVIENIVWEQFNNQIGVIAGEAFIKDNNNQNLDLRKSAHIQTTENFSKGKIAKHNTKINYQQRYDKWQNKFEKDENGVIITHRTRTGKVEATLKKGARKPFDKGRPKGSKKNHTDIDHIISAGEIIRDVQANAHLSEEEQITFANGKTNTNEMDLSLNRSKSDLSMDDWLNNPNANGQKPEEIFNISSQEKAELIKKDKISREENKRIKAVGEKRSIESGKESRKQEAFRIGKSSIKAVVMQLISNLLREVVSKVVEWFKMKNKTIKNLLNYLEEAIKNFINKLQENILNSGKTLLSTILTSIFGPIVGTIKKIWTLLKQGGKSLYDAISYIKSPENKGKSIERLLMEAGKIIVTGATGIAALTLGEVIEKGLMTIPGFSIPIPFLGNLANILGIFFGAVVSGIIGAIAINFIDKLIQNRIKKENSRNTANKQNEILGLQNIQVEIVNQQLDKKKETIFNKIEERHQRANDYTKKTLDEIFTPISESNSSFDDMLNDLESLL